jgi:hypothetical protein
LFKPSIGTILLLAVVVLAGVNFAQGQSLSPYFGLGTGTASAGTSTGCPPQQLLDSFTAACEPAPTIGGLFGVFGADVMLLPHLGINGEDAFRFAQAPYLPQGGVKFRPAFYDFNVVWQPFSLLRIVPVVEGGFGVARVSLYETQTTSITGINSSASFGAGGANHFQEHAAVGVKLYITSHLFLKPQFDFHYVPHLTDQFGRDWVPQYTVAVGYTIGRR